MRRDWQRGQVALRIALVVSGLWGCTVAPLLLLTAAQHDGGPYFVVYSSIALVWYAVILGLGARGATPNRVVRGALFGASAVMALAGGIGGVVFFGASIAALLFVVLL